MRNNLHNLLCVFTLSALCSCSSADSRSGVYVEDETRAARISGREQALRLAPAEGLDSMEMEKILIDVRVRESDLRREGEESLADCYIESFLEALDSVNPSLYNEIGAGE